MSNKNTHTFDSESNSQLRQRLHKLSNRHKELLDSIVDTDQMVIGSIFEVYKTCSKENCCCQRGEKHGPFTAISYSINGKVHHKMIRDDDKATVIKDVGSYKAFQKKRKELRQIQRTINEQLDLLKNLQSREYT
ncbi:MAG: DUF6788 family protein [Agrobacterium sp.]|nr:DUF6788 family protein [Agrobacterium sp.]